MKESITKLIVNDEEFSKWKEYEVETSMLNLANSFSFTASNDDGEMAGAINPCDEVKVIIDDTQILVGYIDEVEYSIDSDMGATVQVTGRDLFSYIIDCSANLKTYKNNTILQIAENLTSGMIENWETTETLSKIKIVKVEPGDTIADVLQKWLKKQLLAIWIDGDGVAHIGKPNYSQLPQYNLYCYCPFISPQNTKYNNILSGSVVKDVRDRFSRYTVHGTRGNTKENKGKNSRSRGYYDDSAVTITRNMLISDGKTRSISEAENLAVSEGEKRIFDAEMFRYKVRGHYGQKPKANNSIEENFFEINTMIDVEDEQSAVSEELYVAGIVYRGSEDGQTTDLELRHPYLWLAQ